MMWMEDNGKLSQGKVLVQEIRDDTVKILVLRPPRQMDLRIDQILSCDYAPDDDGTR